MVVSVFAVRLFQLQGLDAETYAERARAVGAVSEVLPAVRGLDPRPQRRAARGVARRVDDRRRPDEDQGRRRRDRLGPRRSGSGVDYIETVKNLQWPDTRFRYIARRVPRPRRSRSCEELTEPATRGSTPAATRCAAIPPRTSAANIVGYSTPRARPADGAELLFNTLLSGKDGSATYDVGGGNRVPLGDNSTTEPVDGKDLTLTIDRDLQWYTQRVLRQTVEDAGGESGVGRGAGHRAPASCSRWPTTRRTTRTSRRSATAAALGSRAFRDVYEPGSVQKVLTMAALLDAGLVDAATPS